MPNSIYMGEAPSEDGASVALESWEPKILSVASELFIATGEQVAPRCRRSDWGGQMVWSSGEAGGGEAARGAME
jgi:hypothetical protein